MKRLIVGHGHSLTAALALSYGSMSRLNSRITWNALAGCAFAVGVVFLSAMLTTSPLAWFGGLMIAAYCLVAAAAVAGLCGELGVRFPVLGERPARPSILNMPDPPPEDDGQSLLRQALDARGGDLGEALAPVGARQRLYNYCSTCGYPYGRPLATRSCTAQTICAKRREASVARRLQVGRSLAVDPRWVTDHPEAG